MTGEIVLGGWLRDVRNALGNSWAHGAAGWEMGGGFRWVHFGAKARNAKSLSAPQNSENKCLYATEIGPVIACANLQLIHTRKQANENTVHQQ